MHIRKPSDFSVPREKKELLALLLEEEGLLAEKQRPIPQRKTSENLALSFAQQRLWFLNQLVPGNPFYNVPAVIRFNGHLDIAVLERSVNEIVRRHEVLRTSFPEQEGRPLQGIASRLVLPLPVIDLQGIGGKEEQEAVTQQLIRQEAHESFHLDTGPLIRVTLLLLAQEEYVLLLVMHHIVCDGWSLGVFFRELAALYEAFQASPAVGGNPVQLAPLPVQYADYALWQRTLMENGLQEDQLRYWGRQLQGAPTLLELPADFPRPALQSFRGAMNTFTLPASLTAQCKELGRQTGATLFMVLLAAFNVLLHRYTGQSDLVVGSPIANRTRPEVEGLIGFFVNTLALRTTMAGNDTFLALLERVKEVALGAYSHQDLPFERLVEELQPERSLSYTPLVQVLFAVQNVSMEPRQLPGLALQLDSFDEGIAPFDLALFCKERGDEIVVDLVYSTDLFAPATMSRLQGHLLLLLQGAVSTPHRRISELPLLTESEREQHLRTWNHTMLHYPHERHLDQMFKAQVEQQPDSIALCFHEASLTYSELERRANQLAHYLRTRGVGPEMLVGLCLERSVEMIIGVLAILKAGGAYVPLDPAYPSERLAFILRDIQAPVLVTQTHLLTRLPRSDATVICLDVDQGLSAHQPAVSPARSIQPTNLGYVIYTSGSTGKPKGVALGLHTLTNLIIWQLKSYPGAARSLQFTPLSFDISFQEIFSTLCSGGVLVVPSESQRRDPEILLSLLSEQGIERLFLPFVALQSLAETVEQSGAAPDRLREIFTAGEQLRLTPALRHLLAYLHNCRLHNHYGPSESHVITAYTLPVSLETCANFPPIGRPIANGAIYLLDEHLQPVPVGVAGELYIGGERVLARGYLNRPDLTAGRFIPDPFGVQPGGRLYRTGDLARHLPDGTIDFIGRTDFQVKVRGYRVELGEIEVVLQQHPAVQKVVVVAREKRPGEQHLVAYLIPEPEPELLGNELRRYLLEKLPEYMIPSAFVVLKEWPLTPSGKIDRRALPTPTAGSWSGSEGAFVAPRDPVEEALLDIWTQLLGRERISIYHNFFESGGHSLLATQVMSRIRRTFQVELPLRTLFEAPTIAGLAEHIHMAASGEQSRRAPQLRARARGGHTPMSFAQQRMWFMNQIMRDNPAYNIAAGLRLSGKLDVAALARSLNGIVRRHEALRTRFDLQQDEPVQIITPPSALPFPFVDLRGIAAAEQEILLQRITADEGNRIFDLRQGPLTSAVLLRFSTTEYVLLLCLHHIVCDGWSLNVFFRELTIVYEALVAGQPSPLLPLPLQYADYALWQREWLQGEVLASHLSYWRRVLDGLAPIELPTDHRRPLAQTWRGALQEIYLPLALSQSLEALSQRGGVTLFMTLLAAFQVLLWRYSGQEDIAVGTPIANRNRAESEDLIGCFVNTLVLRSKLSGNAHFQEFLQRVKETCLGAYAHQDLPFERIVEELHPERELSRPPLFQVLFALHNLPAPGEVLPGLRVLPLEIELATVKFDLSLSLSETPRGLVAQLRYCTALFEAATMERMLRHWQRLLEGLVAHPEARLADLPLLTTEEEQQLLIEWNAPQEHYTLEGSLSRCFEVQVKRTPDAVALVGEEGCLTYGELNRRANQLASYLRGYGTASEVMVGLWMEHSPELLIGVLGTLKAGAAYVPLDANTPLERLHFLLRDASIRILLTRLSLREKLGRAAETRVLYMEELWERPGMEPVEETETSLPLETAAYVLYTSGSTGQPKGVVVAHRQVLNYVEAIRRRVAMGPEASYALLQPLTVDSSLTMLWGALLSGGRLLLIGKEQGLDAEELATVFAREPVHYLKIAPSHLAALLAGKEPERLLPRRALIIGGEVSHQEWAQEVAVRMPEGRMFNHYGPTEAAVGVLTHPVEISKGTGSAWGVHTPLGKPLGKSQMYVLDVHMWPVPVGVPGELYIGGEQVARGYLGRPELTAERFVPDPYGGGPGARLYRTGDIVRYHADGVLDFIGRQDEQVKIRGYRVEPGEIEAALSQHPQVREALVVTREAGAGEKRLVGYVTVEEENALLSQDVLRFVRERLPEYMVPAAVVTLKQWPRTPHGKIDRQALPVPDMTQSLADEGSNAPRTAVEALLAAIWTEMLGVDHVGIHDNFFDLGGDSILSIRVVARARQAGLNLTPRQLFQAQSIAELAPLIGQQAQGQAGQWGMEAGLIPLTPIQRWFFEKLLPEPHHWNQPLQLKLSEEIDEPLLEVAVQQVFRQHAILRAHCIQGTDGWQLVLPEETTHLPWRRIDLSMLSAVEQEQLLEEQATHVQAGLSLTASPLGGVALFDLGPERGRHLQWIMHHLLVDTVSWGILLEDLRLAYQCLQRGQAPRLPLPTTPFARWSRLLREYAHSSELQAELAYWQDICREDIAAIPVDFPVEEGSNTEGLARTVEVSLTIEETQALVQEVPEVYRTRINDVLLTALMQSFARWTGEPRLLLHLEGHGREELFEDVDLTRSVGWFTIRFPVLLSLDTADSKGYLSEPGEALIAVKEQLRRIPNHGIGYGVLRYHSQDKEAVARLQAMPSPQVSFNYFGRVDAAAEVSALFEVEQNLFGRARSLRGERGYWLEINGQVVAGRLTLEWAYSERIHRRTTIEKLADDYIEALRAIIAHCQSPEAGGYTLSDFPLAMLDEQKLRTLEKLLEKRNTLGR